MASAAQSMPMPPSMSSGGPSDNPNGSGTGSGASPSSPTPSPMEIGTQLVIQAVRLHQSIAKAYPATAPEIREINDLMRKVQSKMMAAQSPGEPVAPPTA